ncbi:GNAT family N-acetyltransferase [Lysobacter sp. 5GHs7-4]|uniref:GNAT family N-acetyltransferase n=1 Tax=Lysobacter sp. 5GHs7-4 TaxID=2904253 RepID=UPI0018525AA9|nr:GNAT family N-acetyltransferase [Lysobacter sp. 5GHs7-4]NUO76032.1 GNAT family N-acetyltransferase [Lysobacter sp.]UHQ23876.1 GNAT family N-acetyltransferase [Lysobacter sp. 5GHs7-4]
MSHELRLRPCAGGDEAALALVGQASFLETFAGILGGRDIVQHCERAHAPSVYRAWLDDPACALWLAEAEPGDAPVGYAVVAPAQLPLADLAADDLELKRIYLLSRFHGGGWGKRLLAAAVAHARAAGARRLLLGVYAGNAAAIGFYERAGFRAVGTRSFNVGGRDYDDRILSLALD